MVTTRSAHAVRNRVNEHTRRRQLVRDLMAANTRKFRNDRYVLANDNSGGISTSKDERKKAKKLAQDPVGFKNDPQYKCYRRAVLQSMMNSDAFWLHLGTITGCTHPGLGAPPSSIRPGRAATAKKMPVTAPTPDKCIVCALRSLSQAQAIDGRTALPAATQALKVFDAAVFTMVPRDRWCEVNTQEDAHDVVLTIVSHLLDDCYGRNPQPPMAPDPANGIFKKELIEAIFKLECSRTMTCTTCLQSNTPVNVSETGIAAGIVRRGGNRAKLHDCIDYYFNEVVEGWTCSNNLCPSAGQPHNGVSKSRILAAPDCLVIEVKRFRQENSGAFTKDHTSVSVPFGLDLSQYMDPTVGIPQAGMYELQSVVHHKGTLHGGHYICRMQHNGTYYEMNDAKVSQISKRDMVKDEPKQFQPYLMFYKAVGGN